MANVDYQEARDLLEKVFVQAETLLREDKTPKVSGHFAKDCDKIFKSSTQAFREVLLGCILARVQDRGVDVHLPYVSQGEASFNGRTLDEKAVNPFLHERRIPCSKGPYLNVFRRSVKFQRSTREGVRDKKGFDGFLRILAEVQATTSKRELIPLLRYLLYRFAQLREASSVPVSRLKRISLEQCEYIISQLLACPSGGRFPVFVSVAAFSSVREAYDLPWEVRAQDINVADAASGAGGDITICSEGQVVLSAEVTERLVDRSRLVATFNTKISPGAIEDYLFLVTDVPDGPEVADQVRRYFAQGHDVNFLEITKWIIMLLGTLGRKGREAFVRVLADRIDDERVPRYLKIAWNSCVTALAEGKTA